MPVRHLTIGLDHEARYGASPDVPVTLQAGTDELPQASNSASLITLPVPRRRDCARVCPTP
jgi:hypothetical protein